MARDIIVNALGSEKRAALREDGRVFELYIERAMDERVAGNIYKGRVENVLPGMQAAFVNIGLERNAFLYVDDVPAQMGREVVAREEVDLEDAGDSAELQEAVIEVASKADRRRRRSINEVLRVGQEVIVQVSKEAIGTKGARVVSNLTIPGRYLVLMPTVNYIGVSRRIEGGDERERLKSIAAKIKPKSMGVIVRTVAEGQSERDLQRDMKFLIKVWEKLQARSRKVKAPALLYRDHDLIYRLVRDYFTEDIEKLVIDSRPEYEKARDLLGSLSPGLRSRIEYFNLKEPIFDHYGIEAEIERALRRRVWLDCGGYLVIDETEALVSIDVNTGKFIGSTNLSDTVLATNLQAASEIARQLRLRNMAGIIIVDFIDMVSAEDRAKVLALLEEEVRKDKVKTNIVGFTSLGLVEITRKKVRPDLDEVLQKRCPCCDGTGRILSEETIALKVERQLISLAAEQKAEAIFVNVHPLVGAVLIGTGGTNLHRLEQLTEKIIYVKGSEHLPMESVNILFGSREEVEKKALPVQEGQIMFVTISDTHAANPRNGIARVEGYVLDIEGAGEFVGRTLKVEIVKVYRTYAKGRIVDTEVPGDQLEVGYIPSKG
ncbi:MAG: Rne/Rng family ribonuclease [Syntrophothermus sp.]